MLFLDLVVNCKFGCPFACVASIDRLQRLIVPRPSVSVNHVALRPGALPSASTPAVRWYPAPQNMSYDMPQPLFVSSVVGLELVPAVPSQKLRRFSSRVSLNPPSIEHVHYTAVPHIKRSNKYRFCVCTGALLVLRSIAFRFSFFFLFPSWRCTPPTSCNVSPYVILIFS